MTEFAGKTVLVADSGNGVGFATAWRMVDAGANVVLAPAAVSRVSFPMSAQERRTDSRR